MKKVWVASAAFAVAIGAMGAYFYATYDSMTASCEEAIKFRLKSPSSYKRISVDSKATILSKSEYIDELNKDGTPDNIKKTLSEYYDENKRPEFRHERFISYEAANSFGAMIRGIGVCEYVSNNKRPSPYSLLVKVNGLNQSEWLREQMR